jgi:imidazolonepropionase-like amidohydrolase
MPPDAARVREGHATTPISLQPGDIWIRDVTVASSERAGSRPNLHVVLRGDRIDYVGEVPPTGAENNVTVIPGIDRFLTAGLIDAHVHPGFVAGMPPASRGPLVEAYFRQVPRSYLYYGFTTLVDLDGTEPNRIAQLRAAPAGPTILECGGGIPIPRGYPMSFAPEDLGFEVFSNFLVDGAGDRTVPQKFRLEEHTPQAVVERAGQRGAVCLKTYYEPGYGRDAGKLPLPTLSAIRQLARAAHKRGLPLIIHANSLEAHRFAVDAGADAVAHGLWRWGTDGPSDESGLPPTVRDVLDSERAAGIAYVPTSRVLDGLGELFDPNFLRAPLLRDVLPLALVEWYGSSDGQWFAREMRSDWGGRSDEQIRSYYCDEKSRGRCLRYAADRGNRIIFGSDTPSGPTYANPPGLNGHLELRSMERYGMSPSAILRSATLDSARFFRVEDRFGSVERGKVANLLLLREDPLRSTGAFGSIETVFMNGTPIPRGQLSARFASD